MQEFFGIGVGPGDPELLTLKALRLLKESDVICVPVSRRGAKSRAYEIMAGALPEHPRVLELLFPMTGERETLEKSWRDGGIAVSGEIAKGNKVAFITLGDPLLFSTFTYLLREVQDRCEDLRVTVVPGIPAFAGAGAALKLPLAEGEEKIAILPSYADKEELIKTLETYDTVVLLKVNRQFSSLVKVLKEENLLANSYLVSNCGTREEKIVREIDLLEDETIPYLSLVIIRRKGL